MAVGPVPPAVADTTAPDPEHPRANFLRALNVERNAAVGFAFGTLFAAAVFVRFVYLVDRPHSPVLWLMLAFVLAVGTGLLLTVAFTLGSAYRLARATGDTDAGEGRGDGRDGGAGPD